jgi:hypothetical protein
MAHRKMTHAIGISAPSIRKVSYQRCVVWADENALAKLNQKRKAALAGGFST